MNAPFRRPRRIAADEAHSWARNLRLGNAGAKFVLCMLTLYVNGEGRCFVGVPTLAEDCELVENTIRRRLAWLEEIGAIVRMAQWIDEHGRRNSDGRGRRTTDEIALCIEGSADEIEARARGNGDHANPANLEGADPNSVEGADPANREGSDQADPATSPSLALQVGEGPDSLNLNQEEESPPYPPQGGDERTHDDRTRGREATESLAPFIAAYPEQLIADYARTQAVWAAMTVQDQADAIVGAKGYAKLIRKERLGGRNRSVKDAHSWLRNRQWTGYLGAGKTIEAAKQRCDAAEGSDEWRAWTVFYRCCGRRGIPDSAILSSTQGANGLVASVPRQWPPVGRGLDPDNRKWPSFAEGTPQFAAWLRKLREIDVSIGMGTVMIDGKQVRALRVPCEWPPGKQVETAAQSP
jgi:Helix-turn-helix domain